MGGLLLDGSTDAFEGCRQVSFDILCVEAEQSVSSILQEDLTCGIALLLILMDRPIHFHDEA